MKNIVVSPKITIFMPVYNGSKYLHESIKSVLNQTYNDFELICVDDSSTDDSYLILQEYSKLDSRIVVYQKINGGNVPCSWNFVIPYIRGKYTMYMSQDDFLSKNTLELSYARIEESESDMVLPDLVFYRDGNIKNRIIVGVNGNREAVLTGEQAFILSLNWSIHGFALCKTEMFKSEIFDENIFNSDEYITRKNFIKSNKVAFSAGKYFYRIDNPNAITKVFRPHTTTALLTDQKIMNLMHENNIKRIYYTKYWLKSLLRLAYYRSRIALNRNSYDVETLKKIKEIFRNHLKYLLSKRNL